MTAAWCARRHWQRAERRGGACVREMCGVVLRGRQHCSSRHACLSLASSAPLSAASARRSRAKKTRASVGSCVVRRPRKAKRRPTSLCARSRRQHSLPNQSTNNGCLALIFPPLSLSVTLLLRIPLCQAAADAVWDACDLLANPVARCAIPKRRCSSQHDVLLAASSVCFVVVVVVCVCVAAIIARCPARSRLPSSLARCTLRSIRLLRPRRLRVRRRIHRILASPPAVPRVPSSVVAPPLRALRFLRRCSAIHLRHKLKVRRAAESC
jgi:hypothetical protein